MKTIAESAYNHNGDVSYLIKLAEQSKIAQADFFTVQIMSVDSFCVSNYSKYQIYKENSLTEDQWLSVFDYCKRASINLIPCILDESSFAFCYNYGYRFYKLHATDILNKQFLLLLSRKEDCKYILETQCCTYQDIKFALDILKEKIKVIMHGYSNYPTELEDLQLNAIDSLKSNFPGFEYGFADHSSDVIEIPLMALTKGYDYVEKHITLSRNNRNFDWQVSLYPEEFSIMVKTICHYKKALGKPIKHPVENELRYRDIIFKKVVPNLKIQKRSDIGHDYLSYLFNSFDKSKVGIALIARLKSQRLKNKVLLPFCNNTIIEDLYDRLSKSIKIDSVVLATSQLEEDFPLLDLFIKKNKETFTGHPISVIDRMLSLALEKEWGGIFRVTGDNPFTDPSLIDEMIDLANANGLDYVRVNNVPFGISAEFFSTSYLWNLYLKMENPYNSEYLSWFVLNDLTANKGCILYKSEDKRVGLVNLSVDYQEDYERLNRLLERINKRNFTDIVLKDVIDNLDLLDLVDENKIIKLPEESKINLREYLKLWKNIEYKINKEF